MKRIALMVIIITMSTYGYSQNRTIKLSNGASKNNELKLSPTVNNIKIKDAQRARLFIINPQLKSFSTVKIGDTISLDLFSDKQYNTTIDKVEVDINGTTIIRSRLKGYQLGYAIITTSSTGHSFMVVSIPELNEEYVLRSDIWGGSSYMVKLDPKKVEPFTNNHFEEPFDPLSEQENSEFQKAIQAPSSTTGAKAGTGTADPAVIDVMMVYTPKAKAWADSAEGGINNTIATAMTKANLALDNSLTIASMRLVYSNLVSYTERGSPGDKYDLVYDVVPNVFTWRDQYGADLVQMFVYENDYGGLTDQLKSTSGRPDKAFSVISVQRSSTTTNSIHEMGHNIGCGHNASQTLDPGNGLYALSNGYDWIGNDGNRYSSLMTYWKGLYWADGLDRPNVVYFSNPSVTHQGQPTGTATDDNARTIRAMKHIIAAYRASVGCSAPVLNAKYNDEDSKTICIGDGYTLSANAIGGGSCTGTWEYAWYTGTGSDNTYWNGSTWNNAETWGSYATVSNVAPTSTTTYKVKVRCSGEITCTSTDNVGVTVTISSATVPGTVTGGTTICAGLNSGTLTLSGNTGDVVKWQSSTNLTDWSDIINTATTYTAPTVMQTTYYRAVVKNGPCSESNSTYTTVTVTAAPQLPTGGNGIRCSAGTVTITATPQSGDQVNWYAASTGGTALLTNNTSYTTPSISSTTSYYAETYNSTSGCKSTSRVEVIAAINIPPTISTQPQDAEVCTGVENGFFVVSATGGELSYQWQENISGSWLNVTNGGVYAGATDDSLIISLPPATMNGYQYRCVVSSGCAPDATSSAVLMNVGAMYCGNNGDYRSKATGNWNATATWEIFSGGAWINATNTPGSTNSVNITIKNGHTVTHNVSNYTGGSSNKVVVESGGSLTINNNSTYWTQFNTLAINSGATLTQTVGGVKVSGSSIIDGTFINTSTKATPTSFDGGCTVTSTGIYRHNVNGGTVPTLTWNSGSTLEITGITSTMPTATGTFQNVTWNCASQSATAILEGNLNTINGNFRVINSNSQPIVVGNTTTDRTITVGGNCSIEGGILALKGGTNSAGNMKLLVNGNYTQSGGTLQLSRRASSSTGTSTLELKGDFTLSSGTITNTDATNGVGEVVFSKTGTQLYTKSGGTISNKINFTVNSGSILNVSTSIIDGSTGTFTLASGSGLMTANINGISSSGATGSVQVSGSRSFNIGANYTYNGTLAQISGNGLPASVNNLTINNNAGLTLTNSVGVSSKLYLTLGVITPGGNTLTILSSTSSAIEGGSSTAYVNGIIYRTFPNGSASGGYEFPIGKSGIYFPLLIESPSSTGATVIKAEIVQSNCGGSAGTGLGTISNTEYWQTTVTSGSYQNGSISLGKSSGLSTFNSISRSATINGVYANLEGTVAGTSVIGSNPTGATLGYFALATLQAGCVAPTLNAQYNNEDSKSICVGESYTLSANPTSGFDCSSWEYAWYTGTGTDNSYWNGTSWNNAETWGDYSTISNVAPSNTTTYKVKVRCFENNGCAGSDASGVSVTVNPISVGGTVTGGTTICSGSTSSQLTLDGITGSVVRWESSVSPFSAWTAITNTTSTYTSGALTETTQFRAVVQSGSCATANSTSTTVTVNPGSVGGSIAGGSNICTGNTSEILTLSGYSGTIIRWESAVLPFSSWNTINNTTTTYTSGALSATTQFRAVVQNGSCSEANSTTTSVTVSPLTVAGSVSGGTTPITLGQAMGTITLSGYTGSVVKWQKRVDLGTWSDITNTNTTYSETPSSAGSWEYRAVVQSGSCSVENSSSLTIVVNAVTANVGDYRSKATGNWNVATTWETWNGSAWVESGFPTSANGVITIRNGHTVSVAGSPTVDQVVVEIGGNVTILTSTLTIANGVGDDFVVYGTLRTTATSNYVTINASAVLKFESGGIYRHSGTGSGTIPLASWNVNSTCLIDGITTGTSLSNINQNFGNFTWNCTNQTSTFIIENNMTINGSLSIQSTGTTTPGMLILGNTTTDRTITVANDFNFSGGTLALKGNGQSAGNEKLIINGNFNQTGGVIQISRRTAASTGTATMEIKGDITFTSGTITNLDATNGIGEIIFNKTGIQTYSKSSGIFSNIINFTINSGAILNMGSSLLDGSTGTFTLNSGAGLITANTNGISSTGATGSIQVSGTRSYSSGANYTYNGSSAQITGVGLPSSVNQLTVDNNLGVTLSNGLAINGILTFNHGKLVTNSNSLVINNGASISGADSSKYIVGSCSKIGSTDFQFPIGNSTYYAPIGIKDLTALSQFTATYQNSPPTNSSLKSSTLATVSQCEYWDLTRNSGGNAKVVLSWSESGRSCGIDVAYTKVAHWNGSLWEDIGATNLSGDAAFGTVTSTLMTSFSPFTLSYSSVTLPIELIYFDTYCEKENTILKWGTASEINAHSFVIQQSENLTEWTDLGVVSAHDNSNQLIEYRYNIESKSNKRIYYRLKMIDNDNSYEFSSIKSANCQSTHPSFNIFPNPSSGLVKIVSAGIPINYSVRVINLLGVVVYENKEPKIEDFMIDMTDYKNGLYFIELKTDGALFIEKIVKQ